MNNQTIKDNIKKYRELVKQSGYNIASFKQSDAVISQIVAGDDKPFKKLEELSKARLTLDSYDEKKETNLYRNEVDSQLNKIIETLDKSQIDLSTPYNNSSTQTKMQAVLTKTKEIKKITGVIFKEKEPRESTLPTNEDIRKEIEALDSNTYMNDDVKEAEYYRLTNMLYNPRVGREKPYPTLTENYDKPVSLKLLNDANHKFNELYQEVMTMLQEEHHSIPTGVSDRSRQNHIGEVKTQLTKDFIGLADISKRYKAKLTKFEEDKKGNEELLSELGLKLSNQKTIMQDDKKEDLDVSKEVEEPKEDLDVSKEVEEPKEDLDVSKESNTISKVEYDQNLGTFVNKDSNANEQKKVILDDVAPPVDQSTKEEKETTDKKEKPELGKRVVNVSEAKTGLGSRIYKSIGITSIAIGLATLPSAPILPAAAIAYGIGLVAYVKLRDKYGLEELKIKKDKLISFFKQPKLKKELETLKQENPELELESLEEEKTNDELYQKPVETAPTSELDAIVGAADKVYDDQNLVDEKQEGRVM